MKLSFKPALVAGLAATALLSACSSSGSPTTPTTPVAAPTITEDFSGILPVGGLTFWSFTIVQNGTVNISLNSVTGNGVPPTVTLQLGLGHPAATTCNATSVATTVQTPAPQISSTYAPGVWCVSLSDPGNLPGPANFDITIAHP